MVLSSLVDGDDDDDDNDNDEHSISQIPPESQVMKDYSILSRPLALSDPSIICVCKWIEDRES